MGSGREPGRDTIVAIITFYKEGYKCKDIATHVGIGVRQVQKWTKRFRDLGENIPTPKPRSGRPRKISNCTSKVIRRQLDKNPTLTARKLKENNHTLLQGVSVRCISDHLCKDLKYRSKSVKGLMSSMRKEDEDDPDDPDPVDSPHTSPTETERDETSNSSKRENEDTYEERASKKTKFEEENSNKEDEAVKAELSGILEEVNNCLNEGAETVKSFQEELSPLSMDDDKSENISEEVDQIKKTAKKKLHRLARKELEEIILKEFSERILYQHELGKMKQLCDRLEATLETNRKKTAQFHKEIEDMRKVTSRLAMEHQARKAQCIAPVKIKRSVGIQAAPHIINKGIMFATGGQQSRVTTGRSQVNSSSMTNTASGSQAITAPTSVVPGNIVPSSHSYASSQAVSNVAAKNSPQQGQMVMVAPKTVVHTVAQPASANKGKAGSIVSSSGALVKLPNNAAGQLTSGQFLSLPSSQHPAPLPPTPVQRVAGTTKELPPQPILKLTPKDKSIVLSWTMSKTSFDHEGIASYQLYAYLEGTAPPSPSLWKKVGSVKALELPMACTLNQFMPGHRYHFAVRGVDNKSRLGPFSEPRSIMLEKTY